jgi:GDPmannose 4,6-dehydratase
MGQSLVIGVNGQDGSYLAEHLLASGLEVVGVGRQTASRHVQPSPRFTYRALDLTDSPALLAFLADLEPARIYYLAAVHGASGFSYEEGWQAALQVNLGAVQLCLDYLRRAGGDRRLLYASSLKAFGTPPPAVVSEASPRLSPCLYSITKNGAFDLIEYYRRQHGVRATVLFLLNHESPRRPARFFLPRLTGLLAAALKGEAPGDALNSLDFACDWGSSAEFMTIAERLLERDDNQDYVLATGKTWTGLEITEALFAAADLDWRDHVRLATPPGSDPVHRFRADIGRLEAALGRRPERTALDVARWILLENHGLDLGEGARQTMKVGRS